MNKFRADYFCRMAGNLAVYQARFETARRVAADPAKLTEWLQTLVGHVRECKLLFNEIGHKDGVERLGSIQIHLTGGNIDAAVAATNASHARTAVEQELEKLKFLYVAEDRAEFLDNESLFGAEVHERFKTAREDICAAGNCLAAECTTAAVFHLMRVAEYGLRDLASRVRPKIKLTDKGKPLNIEYADWQKVLDGIRGSITAARQLPKGPAKEARIQFFSDTADQCEYIKDIWRNTISHTRRPYNREEALGVLRRVHGFMVALATPEK